MALISFNRSITLNLVLTQEIEIKSPVNLVIKIVGLKFYYKSFHKKGAVTKQPLNLNKLLVDFI